MSSLLNRVQLLLVSSAECERGFSCVNISDTPVRSRIAVNTLASLVFIKANSPPSVQFKPPSYVENSWKKAGIPHQICQLERQDTCTCLFSKSGNIHKVLRNQHIVQHDLSSVSCKISRVSSPPQSESVWRNITDVVKFANLIHPNIGTKNIKCICYQGV